MKAQFLFYQIEMIKKYKVKIMTHAIKSRTKSVSLKKNDSSAILRFDQARSRLEEAVVSLRT